MSWTPFHPEPSAQAPCTRTIFRTRATLFSPEAKQQLNGKMQVMNKSFIIRDPSNRSLGLVVSRHIPRKLIFTIAAAARITLTGLSTFIVSALDEREQVGVDRVCLSSGHAVWKTLVGLERCVLEELC